MIPFTNTRLLMLSKSRSLSGIGFVLLASLIAPVVVTGFAQDSAAPSGVNLAPMARVATSLGGLGGNGPASPINNGIDPASSNDREHGALGGRRGGRGQRGGGAPEGKQTQWVEYRWTQPVSTKAVDVYWLIGGGGQRGGAAAAPGEYRLRSWNGTEFVPVENATGLGSQSDKYNPTRFTEVKSDRLRLEYDYEATNGTPGILQWKVYDSGNTPNFPPVVVAGIDRDVMVGGKTYLSGSVKDEGKPKPAVISWSKESGPGTVTFADARAPVTTATFSAPGDYVLKLTGDDGEIKTSETLSVKVQTPPPADRLDVVYTKNYRIDSPLWNARAKALIVNWIPHCIDQINRTNLTQGQGGIDNFIEAAKALRGEPHAAHKGYVFANAWVHQTVESMCIALMVDPQGDPGNHQGAGKNASDARGLDSENSRRAGARWLSADRVHAAQSERPLAGTLVAGRRGNHEGYIAGYFIESAINHYTMTNGKDKRLYNAAKKLADCWANNLGPGKKEWYDGHQEMEQALVRFGRFVNDMEGRPAAAQITALKATRGFRSGRQLHPARQVPARFPERRQRIRPEPRPGQQQYEAVGHAVRATVLLFRHGRRRGGDA